MKIQLTIAFVIAGLLTWLFAWALDWSIYNPLPEREPIRHYLTDSERAIQECRDKGGVPVIGAWIPGLARCDFPKR